MKKTQLLHFAVLTLFISISFLTVIEGKSLIPDGTQALDFTLKDLTSGGMRTFSDYLGKVVVLGFFTSYGDYDALMIDVYAELHTFYSSSKVVVMMVDIDPAFDTEEILIPIIAAYEIQYMVFRDDGTIAPFYDILVSPGFYIIDKNHKTYFGRAGVADFDFISGKVDIIIPKDTNTPTGGLSEFWESNWIWFMLGGIGMVLVSGLLIYRRRIVVHNKKVREEKSKTRIQRQRQRNR